MKFINEISLSRGSILVEHAFSAERGGMELETADLIGIVVAYVLRRGSAKNLQAELSMEIGSETAQRAQQVFDVFDDPYGRGLWREGASLHSVEFTHHKLRHLNRKMEERLHLPESNL